MDKYETHELLLYFKHRGQQVHLTASAKGWAQMWLRKNPYTVRTRRSRYDYEQDALRQGHIAINSIVRDWVKGQCAAIESGVVSFEAVFMPFMADKRRAATDRASSGVIAYAHRGEDHSATEPAIIWWATLTRHIAAADHRHC
jgi:hypothetical protein